MITKRQAQILAAIVKEYSSKGRPVGSEELAQKYNFGISSATIRNEMKFLEDEGLVSQPHTSAGRVPTNAGYRYFVNKLMKHLELTSREQERLQSQLRRLRHQYLELGRSLTKLLAEKTEGAAFALLPKSVSASGISNVIDSYADPLEIKAVVQFFDELADYRQTLVKRVDREVETFIGREAPVPLSRDYSLIIRRISLPGGGKGVVGIVGPKRMKYARNISLLEYISKFLSSGFSTIFIIMNF